MNPELVTPLSEKPQFGGTVELVPPPPLMIEFVGKQQVCCFPIHLLTHFALEANSGHDGKETTPPDQLTLNFPTAVVTLLGWRLEMMLDPLGGGRVGRVRAVDAALALEFSNW